MAVLVEPLPLVDLAAAHAELGDELEAAVLRVCRTQQFVGGAEVEEFERDFAAFLGAEHVIGVSNGTAAIELVLRAHGLGPGDEVLIPANTFVATAGAVSAVGATPRFVDVDPRRGLIDLDSARTRVTAATRAIIPVHLYGRLADMYGVAAFAAEHDLTVIEDAAQAHGARDTPGRFAGTFGSAGTFSFYPGKNLGAFGDGGAIATNDPVLADRIRLIRDHGKAGDDHILAGGNHRLDALQAAVLAVKLSRLDEWNARRRAAAALYRERLPAAVLDGPSTCAPESDVHHLFPILVDDRDALLDALAREGIGAGVHYRRSIPETTAYAHSTDACPVAASRAARQLSLPMHPHLDHAAIEHIAAVVAGNL